MKKHILFLSLFIFVFASCDEGRLYQDRLIVPEEGRVVKLHVNMSGVDRSEEHTSELQSP